MDRVRPARHRPGARVTPVALRHKSVTNLPRFTPGKALAAPVFGGSLHIGDGVTDAFRDVTPPVEWRCVTVPTEPLKGGFRECHTPSRPSRPKFGGVDG